MSTLRQLIRNPRKKSQKIQKTKSLKGNPQVKGICLKLIKIKPKKPNSAQRKVGRIKLSTGKNITTYFPGEGKTNLSIHSTVLIQGGRTKDLPGLHYKAIRGKYHFLSVENRKTSKTKYGIL